jgi:ribonuclease HII
VARRPGPPPLVELRARVEGLRSERALRQLLLALRGDPRSGARRLAAVAQRRLARRRAEARRLAGLFRLRQRLLRGGARLVAGVDEVGMGPLAGPIVAAAVVLPERVDLPGLDDSKRLTRRARERLSAAIHDQALALAVAEVPVVEVDRLNVYRAGLEALRRAVAALSPAPDHVLVDARHIPDLGIPQTSIVGGDARDGSIAAASIVAKVHRDALMCRLHERYPEYGFERHMGYATRRHLAALRRHGPSPAHRRSFSPVAQLRLF